MPLKVQWVVVALLVMRCSCVPTDSQEEDLNKESRKKIIYCQPQTPCGWRIFNFVDQHRVYLNNDYCICSPNERCRFHLNKIQEGYFEYRCK